MAAVKAHSERGGAGPAGSAGAGPGQAPQQPPPEPPKGPSESINFKDLPPEGKVQLAAKAGIRIATPAPDPVKPVAK